MLTRRTLLASTTGAALVIGLAPMVVTPAFARTPRNVAVMAKQIDDMVSLDPGESYEFTDNEVDANCYSKLIVPNPDDGTKIVGDLAESWTVSPDGMTITFHLRQDKRFASGNPVTPPSPSCASSR
jgi:peptide/nickel transport system substrate-binding protein